MELQKHLEKIGLQITIQGVTLKIMSYRIAWEKEKEKVKILHLISKTNNL
jgi:hypothetical protein